LISQIYTEDEVIVIDNKSTDDTHTLVKRYQERNSFIKYFYEPETGLSHARNRGAKEANREWLLFIDDDALAFPDLMERFKFICNNYDFDCFGGTHIGYFIDKKPKWLNAEFGTMKNPLDQIGYLNKPLLTGGLFAIKKSVLFDVGLFNIDLGMKGNVIGYAEEDEIQKRLLMRGFRLGFDPEFKIYHPVLKHKLALIWHLKSSFAHGRDGEKSRKEYNLADTIFLLLRSSAALIIKLPFYLLKGVAVKDYYWQNAVLDSIGPIFYRCGQVNSKFL
jgi:glycosyltransferase involved in cell wall biosynthesis